MAKRRPSYVSIRARQRNIIEGLGTTDLRYAEAAKRFGVTPRELKTFVETKPRKLRTNFNRSDAYSELYEKGARSQVRQQLGISKVKRYKFRPQETSRISTTEGFTAEEVNRRKQIGEMILNLHLQKDYPRTQWAIWTREHNLPTSIKAIKLLYRNDRLSDDEYLTAIVAWRDTYNGTTRAIDDNTYAMYEGALPEDVYAA